MVVSIDGPAGAGKSTVAARVAESTGLLYINSGYFYRSISKVVLDSGQDPQDRGAVIRTAERCRFELRSGELYVNGSPAGNIHNDLIDRWAPAHSSIPEVRRVVNRALRALAEGRDILVEGRDMGTVVFPDAEVKIYLDATVAARARRRHSQGVSALDEGELRRRMIERDSIDRSKPVGALVQAGDAQYIDTSDLTIQEVCDRVKQAVLRQKAKHSGD